jgi:predicted amidophosphoribosyltransferase
VHIKTNNYYCEECGMELNGRGSLCPDCSREVRNLRFPPKKSGASTHEVRGKKPKKPKRDNRLKRGSGRDDEIS